MKVRVVRRFQGQLTGEVGESKREHMPSKKKRFSILLSHDLHRVVQAWGQASGTHASTVVAAFLEENKPIIEAMTAAIEARKGGKEEEAIKAMAVLTGAALSHLGEAMKGKRSK